MELLNSILAYIEQYQAIALVVLVPLMDIFLKRVETKKPISIIDKVLDLLGYGFYLFGLGPIERLIKKIRELYLKIIPERLKPE